MKNNSNNYFLILLLLILSLINFSCNSDDNQLLLNNSQQSLGHIKSLVILSGENRVMVKGVIDDPKVSELKIYWNDKSDSVVVPINTSNEIDSVEAIIDNLQEKLYIFEVQTFNEEGLSSKIVTGGAEAFGSDYANSLENRSVVFSKLNDNTLDITFAQANANSGIIGTEFYYANTEDENKELFIAKNEVIVSISDFKIGSTYRYRTAFVPSTVAMDTFYTAYANFNPVQFPKLKNASAPIEAAEVNGRWGNLADWISNDAVKNHDGYGGWDSRNGFNVESGWGAPGIINGKIYQVVTAGAANYTLNVVLNGNNHQETDEGGFYLVVAKGEGLPDVENIASASEVLGYARVVSSNLNYVIDFTVDETMEISVGIVTTQDDSGRYTPINSFELVPGSN
ncbi:DUF4998 domain-containing protein [Gramella sp. AN32]|uniref:DUF4998 domain-containing protein n=1 Tax=Christiangramia antarctica TaxID=2058158 RepID=A0ABW5X2K2_9FLAO|nr:DUF4998 domain-containing protein [Gramella sp. AN32]